MKSRNLFNSNGGRLYKRLFLQTRCTLTPSATVNQDVKFLLHMTWLRQKLNKLFGHEMSPPDRTGKFPTVLALSLEISNERQHAVCTGHCVACKSELRLQEIFKASVRFYFYPGNGYARGERVPVLMFDCLKCGERQYLAIFPDYIEAGMFGCSPVMDLIPIEKIDITVKYELLDEKNSVESGDGHSFFVQLDANYYARI